GRGRCRRAGPGRGDARRAPARRRGEGDPRPGGGNRVTDFVAPRGAKRSAAARAGVVYLVGAGPGDPGLMTTRSLELIAGADAIFYDRLIPPGALAGAREDGELVYVGKQPGVPSVPQEEIGERLVAAAKEGKSVV